METTGASSDLNKKAHCPPASVDSDETDDLSAIPAGWPVKADLEERNLDTLYEAAEVARQAAGDVCQSTGLDERVCFGTGEQDIHGILTGPCAGEDGRVEDGEGRDHHQHPCRRPTRPRCR